MKTYLTMFPQDIDARIIFGFFSLSTITMCEVTKSLQSSNAIKYPTYIIKGNLVSLKNSFKSKAGACVKLFQ